MPGPEFRRCNARPQLLTQLWRQLRRESPVMPPDREASPVSMPQAIARSRMALETSGLLRRRTPGSVPTTRSSSRCSLSSPTPTTSAPGTTPASTSPASSASSWLHAPVSTREAPTRSPRPPPAARSPLANSHPHHPPRLQVSGTRERSPRRGRTLVRYALRPRNPRRSPVHPANVRPRLRGARPPRTRRVDPPRRARRERRRPRAPSISRTAATTRALPPTPPPDLAASTSYCFSSAGMGHASVW
jgi:hypothetical protein